MRAWNYLPFRTALLWRHPKQFSLYFKFARSYKTSREEKFGTESAGNFEPVGLESAIWLCPVHGPGYRRAGARSPLGILIHFGAI